MSVGDIEVVEAVQEVDAVAVLGVVPDPSSVQALERPGSHGRELIRSVAPATQAAAVAAGGFLAGAAAVGLLARLHGRGARAPARGHRGNAGRAGRGARGRGGAGELVRIVGTRSLLVDIHLLDSAGR